ncbi:hypothetical protein DFH11DRAFT_1253064 [Phellopilus nigrolimitatus]|nr:hypothetical protein DFH11DRAFT_1253064 [Phellopilus nigrolimitatus]
MIEQRTYNHQSEQRQDTRSWFRLRIRKPERKPGRWDTVDPFNISVDGSSPSASAALNLGFTSKQCGPKFMTPHLSDVMTFGPFMYNWTGGYRNALRAHRHRVYNLQNVFELLNIDNVQYIGQIARLFLLITFRSDNIAIPVSPPEKTCRRVLALLCSVHMLGIACDPCVRRRSVAKDVHRQVIRHFNFRSVHTELIMKTHILGTRALGDSNMRSRICAGHVRNVFALAGHRAPCYEQMVAGAGHGLATRYV